MTDIKALLLEAAAFTDSMHTSRGEKAYLELTDRLRAAAESMGEPLLAIRNGNIWHTEAYGRMEIPKGAVVYLYRAPPPPAVPEALALDEILTARERDVVNTDYCRGLTDGWNSCRGAMLAASQEADHE